MATPPAAVGGSGGAFGKLKRVLGANYYVYLAMILTITGGAIVLMTVPAELMTDAPKDGVLDLTTTFATLVRFCYPIATPARPDESHSPLRLFQHLFPAPFLEPPTPPPNLLQKAKGWLSLALILLGFLLMVFDLVG